MFHKLSYLMNLAQKLKTFLRFTKLACQCHDWERNVFRWYKIFLLYHLTLIVWFSHFPYGRHIFECKSSWLNYRKIKCWEKQYAFYLHYCRFFASYSSALLAELIFMLYLLQVRTVKVTNVSLSATVQDIKEFFSFSGDIEHVEMQRFVKFAKFIQLDHSFSFHAHICL